MIATVRLVLVVDDSEDCAATIEIALGAVSGIEVCVTHTAEQALQLLETKNVAAMITDLHLPFMDGLELLEHVRANPRWARIPVLVISGDSDPGTPERMRGAGASAFFAKPYSPLAVRQKLEELINAQ
jgi:two-component system chemotaxis response regulator CheY